MEASLLGERKLMSAACNEVARSGQYESELTQTFSSRSKNER